MIVLIPLEDNHNFLHNRRTLPTVFIFGLGLVGAAIFEKIFSSFSYKIIHLNLNWKDEKQQFFCLKRLVTLSINSFSIEIIWSAGKAGFFSEKYETDEEFKIFKMILEFIADNVNCKKNIRLISSAGGLYEGGRNIEISSRLTPKRPYGELKKKQEDYILSTDNYDFKSIIRLSSIYGYIRKNQRIGLISALIKNTIENKETSIFGHIYTLRDYLFTDDMTRFFIEKVFMQENDCDIYLLSSNKPTSIFEAIKTVENVLNKKSLIRFVDQANSEDITYNEKSDLCRSYSTPLNVGVEKVLIDFLSSNKK